MITSLSQINWIQMVCRFSASPISYYRMGQYLCSVRSHIIMIFNWLIGFHLEHITSFIIVNRSVGVNFYSLSKGRMRNVINLKNKSTIYINILSEVSFNFINWTIACQNLPEGMCNLFSWNEPIHPFCPLGAFDYCTKCFQDQNCPLNPW